MRHRHKQESSRRVTRLSTLTSPQTPEVKFHQHFTNIFCQKITKAQLWVEKRAPKNTFTWKSARKMLVKLTPCARVWRWRSCEGTPNGTQKLKNVNGMESLAKYFLISWGNPFLKFWTHIPISATFPMIQMIVKSILMIFISVAYRSMFEVDFDASVLFEPNLTRLETEVTRLDSRRDATESFDPICSKRRRRLAMGTYRLSWVESPLQI